MRKVLEKLTSRANLSEEESEHVFGELIDGKLTEIELTALIIALKTKGETPSEIAGAAKASRKAAKNFARPDYDFADSCGTGGDGAQTINVSTACAFVVAEAGLPVAKHGNRSVSSKCGSADLLESCGVRLDPTPDIARLCLDETGVCFLFAPLYHAGFRHAAPVRKALGTRTIFNVLGPLINPSAPPYQVLGVYDPQLCVPLATTLGLLGARAALVVHGSGLDEIAIHGPTTAALLRDGAVHTMELVPEDGGVKRHSTQETLGGNPAENAEWLSTLLGGKGSPAHQSLIALNAGALLWIAGRATTFAEGTQKALEILQSGRALDRLHRLARLSHQP